MTSVNTASSLISQDTYDKRYHIIVTPQRVGRKILDNPDKKILLLPLDRFGIVDWLEKHDVVFLVTQDIVGGLLLIPLLNDVVFAIFERMGAELSGEVHDTIRNLAHHTTTGVYFNARENPNIFLRDTAFKRILEAIKKYNPTGLEELNLSGNEIHGKRAEELFEVLKSNTTLKRVILSQNEMDDNDAEKLAQALQANSKLSLELLGLTENKISQVGAAKLAKACFGELDFSFNSIDPTEIKNFPALKRANIRPF